VIIPVLAGALFVYAGYQLVSARIDRKRQREAAAVAQE